MQKMFTQSVAAANSGPQLTSTSTLAPLAPLNLLQAGVPPSEVVWFRRLRPDRQFLALRTARGNLLLERVRTHFAAAGGLASIGLAA